jgi:hypothetical protein
MNGIIAQPDFAGVPMHFSERSSGSGRRGIHDVIRDAHDADHFGHIVDAHDVSAAEDRSCHGRGGAEQALARRHAVTA